MLLQRRKWQLHTCEKVRWKAAAILGSL